LASSLAKSSSVLAFGNKPLEAPAKRRPAISRADCSRENFRKRPDRSRGIARPPASVRRNPDVTYLWDASLWDASQSRALDEMPADAAHRAVSDIAGIDGEVDEIADGIKRTLPRKLDNGRKAGG
jgi:hypothetical protein